MCVCVSVVFAAFRSLGLGGALQVVPASARL